MIGELEHARLQRYYATWGPLLLKHFAGVPLNVVTFPADLDQPGVYHRASERDLPATIDAVDVGVPAGARRHVTLTAHNLPWLVARYAVQFDSWLPTASDPSRTGYARIALRRSGGAGHAEVVAAAQAIFASLDDAHLAAIPLLDGDALTLWIPFDDEPSYASLDDWLAAFAARAVATHPDLLTTANFKRDRGDRVYIGVRSNHPGLGSILPYSIRGRPELPVAVPIARDEIPDARNGDFTVSNASNYFKAQGDRFATLREAIPKQHLPERRMLATAARTPFFTAELELEPPSAHGSMVSATIAVLQDGKTHSLDEILAAAIARGLLPSGTVRKYFYSALHEYILRNLGAGRSPEFLQIEQTSQFRLNRPADDWPDVVLPPLPQWLTPGQIAGAVAAVRATATGSDPTAFEQAACDAFALLGFLATHLGGNAQPDGILVAPLGVAGYKVILECKTAQPEGIVSNPRPEEVAKFRIERDAQFGLLLGPAFGGTIAFEEELQTHQVSLWTVDDLARALEAQIGPDEFRSLLAPGPVTHALNMLLWDRDHGRRKRVAVIAEIIARRAWQAQMTLAQAGVAPADAPELTEEVLALLIDDDLERAGVTGGASRDEARSAISRLSTDERLRLMQHGWVFRAPPAASPLEPIAKDAKEDVIRPTCACGCKARRGDPEHSGVDKDNGCAL